MSDANTNLVEKVARAIADATGSEYGDDELFCWEAEARAAIAVVVEEAAKAAEGFHGNRDWVKGSLYDALRREAAHDIRKLAEAAE